MPIRIPTGKLGTVRVDRTVDAYPTSSVNNKMISRKKLYISKLELQRKSTTRPTPLIIKNPQDARHYTSIEESNYQIDPNDEDMSDIAVIYSLVRRSSTRRTSTPGLSVLLLPTNFNTAQPYEAKSYTLEPPLTSTVTHVSKQAQKRTLSSKVSTNVSSSASKSVPLQIASSAGIRASTSFASHDRPSVPTNTIKTRSYSCRNTGRNAFERQILNITERVSQVRETLFSRTSNSPNHRQNRSSSNFHPALTNTNINASTISNKSLIHLRSKSKIYDRVNEGKILHYCMINVVFSKYHLIYKRAHR